MTAVIFKFQKPDGAPVVGAPFTVALRKPSFDEALDEGILLPGTVEGITDAQGECTLTLVPGYGVYYLSMLVPGEQETPEGCMPGFHYKFSVQDSTEVLRIEDLIVTTPTWSRPWDEQALAIIVDAKAKSQAAAVAAQASAQAASSSAVQANGSAVAAYQDAERAAVSASDALAHKNAASGSAETAATLAEQARVSAVNSGNSANAAAGSATAAANSASNASSAGATAGTTAGTAVANAVVANKQDKHVNLTAFSGLTGVADRLPYFTGAGALSLATLTAKARLFNARTDAAGMRAEITAASSGANSDITSLSGLTTALSVAQGGTGATTAATARTNLGLGTAAVAALVGTVSQAAGVPTGAVMQYGSNANGTFIRFADGTQICSFKMLAPLSVTTGPVNSLYFSSLSWTFPAQFFAPPVAKCSPYSDGVIALALAGPTTTTTYSPGVASLTSIPSRAFVIDLIAIGRWYT